MTLELFAPWSEDAAHLDDAPTHELIYDDPAPTSADAAMTAASAALESMADAAVRAADAIAETVAQLADDAELLAIYDAAWNAVDRFPTPTAICERAALRAVYDAGRAAK